jgi:Undecaprenyl-phosphate glucose phosphotransferase
MKNISRKLLSDALILVDITVIVLACMASYYLYLVIVLDAEVTTSLYLSIGILFAIIYTAVAHALQAYHQDRLANIRHTTTRALMALGVASVGCLLIGFLTKTTDLWSRGWILTWYSLSGTGLIAVRLGMNGIITRWRESGEWQDRIIIVGSPKQQKRVAKEIQAGGNLDIKIVGMFDDRKLLGDVAAESIESSGSFDALIAMTQSNYINYIVLATPWGDEEKIMRLKQKLHHLPIEIVSAFPTKKLHNEFLGFSTNYGIPFIVLGNRPLNDRQELIKRVEDVLFSALAIIITSPILLSVALAIRIDSAGPIIFKQPRYGFNDTIFNIYKFRTMHVDRCDPSGSESTSRGDPRLTRIGQYLRRWSLDELPQLFNVLKGDMSLVGPRPHPIHMYTESSEYRKIVENYAARHRVKPGITGWAQVRGNRGSVDTVEKARERIDLDIEYIRNWSPIFDLYILLLTAGVVLSGKEAY